MVIRKAIFHKSSGHFKDCPKPTLPEYAFIGRSNVGKSSLINMLCNNNKLAKTSASPGKTKIINHFIINDAWYLVDLPGYGYAKTSKVTREGFATLIIDYATKRDSLICLFVLIDSRLPLQQIDLEFMSWLGEKQVPFSIVYTKADKNSKSELARNIKAIEDALLKTWNELPNAFITSAEKYIGKEELLAFMEDHLSQFTPQARIK